MSRRWRVVVVAVVFVAACGADGSGVSRTAAPRLQHQVDIIRSAANGADRSRASRELERLLVDVDQLQAKGELSAAAAARIRHAAATVRSQLSLLPLPTTTTTTSPPSDDEHDNGRGNGHGRKRHETD